MRLLFVSQEAGSNLYAGYTQATATRFTHPFSCRITEVANITDDLP